MIEKNMEVIEGIGDQIFTFQRMISHATFNINSGFDDMKGKKYFIFENL